MSRSLGCLVKDKKTSKQEFSKRRSAKYLYTFSKNDVISSARKHYCAFLIQFNSEPLAAGGQCGFGDGFPTLRRLYSFFQKYAFLCIIWSKFLLKTVFLNGWIKDVDALPRTAFRSGCPHLPSPLLHHWVDRLKAMTNCPYYFIGAESMGAGGAGLPGIFSPPWTISPPGTWI